MIRRFCDYCKKEFETYPHRIKEGKGKYCSVKCYRMGRRKRLIKNCFICGKEFQILFCSERKGYGRFCSRKCKGVWQSKIMIKEKSPGWGGGKRKKNCLTCGKEMFVYPSKIKDNGGKFCSKECEGKHSSTIKGENRYNWKSEGRKKICLLCNKEFEKRISPSGQKKGEGKFCCRKCSTIYRNSHSGNKETLIEKLIEQELIKRGIHFIKQFPLPGIGVIDFILPEKRIAIEADGDYWHRLPKATKRDANKDLRLSFSGYKTYRFWEKDIMKSPKNCINKIKEIENLMEK